MTLIFVKFFVFFKIKCSRISYLFFVRLKRKRFSVTLRVKQNSFLFFCMTKNK